MYLVETTKELAERQEGNMAVERGRQTVPSQGRGLKIGHEICKETLVTLTAIAGQNCSEA